MAEDHTDVSVSQKAEGSVETNQDEIVERDPEAKKSLENITAIVDDKKKEEEINSDPSKKEVAKDTIGTDDTGSNKNVVEKEDESKKAYTEEETTDCSTKEEEQPVAKTEETTEDFKDVEEADDDFLNEVEFDIPEIKVEDEQDEVIAPVVEDTTETTEETTDVVEYVVEETTFVEEETTVANIVVEEETKVVEAATEVAEEKVEDLVINDSFVSTSVDGVATIVANAGRIASANAGEGVNVSVEGNTVRVSLQNPENTVVDVDIVDVNGNIVTAVVAFN